MTLSWEVSKVFVEITAWRMWCIPPFSPEKQVDPLLGCANVEMEPRCLGRWPEASEKLLC